MSISRRFEDERGVWVKEEVGCVGNFFWRGWCFFWRVLGRFGVLSAVCSVIIILAIIICVENVNYTFIRCNAAHLQLSVSIR